MARATQDPALRQYLRDIGRYPLLTREEERDVAHRATAGDSEARERLVVSNLRLVASIAREHAGRGLDLMDLIEEGNLGLLHAVERFDPTAGFRLSTYATWWIRKAIRRALNSSARTVRIPTYMVEVVARAKQAQSVLCAELGRPPTMAEVAQRLALTPTRARLLQRILGAETTSVDAPSPAADGSADLPLSAILMAPAEERPEQVLFNALALRTLEALLARIDEREARILSLRFGLGEDEPRSLREIGPLVGLSRERVRQIELHALEKLKDAMTRAGYG